MSSLLHFCSALRYGPFHVAACVNKAGRNALCDTFWCPKDSYALHSWAGSNVWCNPPFSEIAEVLRHATASYHEQPGKSRALLVLPNWPDAKRWPTMISNSICHCVGYYPAGTQLFTAPPTGNRQCGVMGPTMGSHHGVDWQTSRSRSPYPLGPLAANTASNYRQCASTACRP